MLLLPDGEEAAGQAASYLIVRAEFPRIYAFVHAGCRMDAGRQYALEMMAGRFIHRVSKPRAKVSVLMLPTPACTVSPEHDALARKRSHLWNNAVRNAHIAALAKELLAAKESRLLARGFSQTDIVLIQSLPDERIGLLVESTEHGRAMQTALPNWRFLHMAPAESDMDRASGKQRRDNGPMIITETYASQNGVPIDLLIRATGTSGRLMVKGFPPVKTPGRALVMLIDFVDSFSPRAAQDSRLREEEYRRKHGRIKVLNGTT
jgi:hypothetical protein